ncbi:hypothetical protein KCU87_g403, partial [Aureobasidium melanogenum]
MAHFETVCDAGITRTVDNGLLRLFGTLCDDVEMKDGSDAGDAKVEVPVFHLSREVSRSNCSAASETVQSFRPKLAYRIFGLETRGFPCLFFSHMCSIVRNDTGCAKGIQARNLGAKATTKEVTDAVCEDIKKSYA